MNSILDFIFDPLDIENMDRKEVLQYTAYLKEIIPQLSLKTGKTKFLNIKIRLDRRLVTLDHESILMIHSKQTNKQTNKQTGSQGCGTFVTDCSYSGGSAISIAEPLNVYKRRNLTKNIMLEIS